MNVFYNRQGVGDTLLITLQGVSFEQRTFERKGDVAKIINSETREAAGYNLFNASNYLDLSENGVVSMDEDRLTKINEALHQNGFDDVINADFSPKFVVGYVKSMEKHPNADKLNVCQVDVGQEIVQIVCGAPNIAADQKVVVAKVGAVMPSGLLIKDAELRGVASSGMICSARELALPNAPQEKGILILEDSFEAGDAFPLS
ncbi:YtpR family tRNA-binding protein [Jeotgalibacillus soli]|uniref:tRNA-binding protein n=1 Tax=Jeotgalibacillus soli TaxID=889306 RepID=A0A0C2V4C9_9BACL|nr:DUF4479 family protein [Jeotgalibacillus soli]KIL43887.1 tRNA-binding protein [Jeotgalibacillus soli]